MKLLDYEELSGWKATKWNVFHRVLGHCLSISRLEIQLFNFFTFSWGILSYWHARQQKEGLNMTSWFRVAFTCDLFIYLGA